MSNKFDQYLKKGGFSQVDREAFQVKDAKEVEQTLPPTPVADQSKSRPEAPQPQISEEQKAKTEAIQQNASSIFDRKQNSNQPITSEVKSKATEATQEAPELPKNGVEARYPSKTGKGEERAPENEKDKGRGDDQVR